jgi:DNA-binding response OmpR family regulator
MEATLLLLAEDEQMVQELLESALTDEGFKVVAVHDGTQAMAELDAEGAQFSGVITDIRLGAGPNGWDIGHRAREVFPGIPIIYVSGDSGRDWTSKGVPNSVFIAKPFVSAQIITAITTLLNKVASNRAGLGTDG